MGRTPLLGAEALSRTLTGMAEMVAASMCKVAPSPLTPRGPSDSE